jgi:hypothetical protein
MDAAERPRARTTRNVIDLEQAATEPKMTVNLDKKRFGIEVFDPNCPADRPPE